MNEDPRHPESIENHASVTEALMQKRIAELEKELDERKRAEAILRESEERHRTILQTALDGFCLTDLQARLLEVNDAYCRMSGYGAQELLDMRISDLEETQDSGEIATHLQQIVIRGEHRFETRHRRKDGSVFDVEVVAQYRPGEGGHFVSLIRDITERKRVEQALRESEANLNRAQETANMGSWVDDLSGRLLWSNGMYRIYGVSRSTFTPNDESFINLVHPDDRPAMNEWLRACVAGEKPGELEFRTVFPDGTIHYFRGCGDLVCDAGGRPTHMSGTAQDITEQKLGQEEKEKLQAQLNQAHKMESIGRLAGGVAHDFNNMLGVILGNVDLALHQVDAAQPLHAELVEIRTAASRSADLTRQLMAFARKQTAAPKVLDLNDTVAGILKMLQRLIGEGIDLRWQPEPDLWKVRMDPTQIDQILANLCVNARDAIKENGRITIKTGNARCDEKYCAEHPGVMQGDYVLMEVADDGCGMDVLTQKSLFEPFFTTKEVGKGTGLGLATTYGIVRQNHGFINVSSAPGTGTTFEIYLPRHTGIAERMPKDPAMAPAARGHETILLVEDEPSVLRMTMTILKRQGYAVLAADTPGEAIRLAREHVGEIQLLLTDVIMPEMNGRDLAKNLLSLYPHLKRLFTSGYTADAIAYQGVLDEGVHFIQKPFSVKDLAAKVREVLDSN
jgi:two-component system, cell cycle sensor histidine kinase and response regulator CckA